jgi:pimeloyl-ACP methyl ester carboxylesterase
MKYNLLILLFIVGIFVSPLCMIAQQSDTIVVKEALALPLSRGYADLIIAPNPIEAKLALGNWRAPRLNDKETMTNGDVQLWRSIKSDEKGWFSDSVLNVSCYVYVSVVMPSDRVMILEAMGDEIVYVNGSPRSGNPYCLKDTYESWEPRFDYSLLPVQLRRGKNELLLRCNRGALKVQLYPPKHMVMLNTRDLTIPDFVIDFNIDTWGSVVILNCTDKPIENLEIMASMGTDHRAVPVKTIQPLSVRKAPFHITIPALKEKGKAPVLLTILSKRGDKKEVMDSATIQFRIVEPEDNRKETFFSSMDSSVQYYGINPKVGLPSDKPILQKTNWDALFLTLHGASVEAINQSGSYYPKSWGYIVAPTNRRPYGFNWEGWGRLDALEVMDIVIQRYPIDLNHIYLTGHSMGGHGTWHLGSLYPDKFAAIGPSAGWISFWTYRFRGQQSADTTDIRKMIRRATTPSETFEHIPNLSKMGLYILQGSEDDNVPPEQARSMVEKLRNVHNDFVYHEQPGVGHWWDISDEPGADCVDWAPMFDFFARHARPFENQIREVKFITSNPSVSSKDYWLTIDAQNEQLKLSSAEIRYDPGARRFRGITKNVSRLALDVDLGYTMKNLTVELDSQKITVPSGSDHDGKLWFELTAGRWNITSTPSPEMKGSNRYGTFQEAFRNNVLFVYATGGSSEENKWAFDKARYDAEKLWYQGNGSVEVMADTKFDALKDINRNIVLYGNKNTNKAWNSLLTDSPVDVGNGYVIIGKEKFRGKNLGCIFIRPRKGSRNASVGVVSGTGIVGMKINNRLPYLNPGIGLPDCTVFDSDILQKGENGILFTGFFGLDWTVDKGEFVRKNLR